MAIASTHIWGRLKGFLYELFQEKVKMRRVSITGFPAVGAGGYTTGGLEFDVNTDQGFTEADTTIIIEPDASYRYIYDKSTNKIVFIDLSTAVELVNGTGVDTVTIYCTLIGK